MQDTNGADPLAQAVARVMQRVRYVRQTGENKFHRYKYASDEDILGAIQPEMANEGLALCPSNVVVSTVEHTPTRKGDAQWRTDILVTYTLRHGPSGMQQVIMAAGCGIDGEDKGIYKALTGALKYALRHLFLIPTGEDAERDEPRREPAREEPPPERQKATADDIKALRAAFFTKWNGFAPPPRKGDMAEEMYERTVKAQDEQRHAVTFAWFNVHSMQDDKLLTMDREKCLKFTARLRNMTAQQFENAVMDVLEKEP